PLLADVRFLQPDVLPALRRGLPRHAATRLAVLAEPAGLERLRLCLGVRARLLDAHLHRKPHLVARLRTDPCRRESLALTRAGVAGPDARAGRELRAHSGDHERP